MNMELLHEIHALRRGSVELKLVHFSHTRILAQADSSLQPGKGLSPGPTTLLL